MRVAVVGTGVMGSGHIDYLTTEMSGVDIVAVADVDQDRRQSVISKWGLNCTHWDTLDELLANTELDAVIIASPDFLHASSIETCIERSLPALCEKPLAETLDDAEKVATLHREWQLRNGGDLVHLGFMRRFDAAYQEVKRVLLSGELGHPLMVVSSTRNVKSPGISSEQMLSNIAVHEIDAMRWLLSAEWQSIDVRAARHTSNSPDGLIDPIVLHGQMDNGVYIVADVFANNSYGYDVRLEVSCEGGLVRIDTRGEVSIVRDFSHPHTPAHKMVDNWLPRFRNAYVGELAAWLGVVKGGQNDDLATVSDGLVTAQVLDSLSF
jgi:myo-inositol 2-dehydrogenase/D-chiro-inositol 1-dehydrogenase